MGLDLDILSGLDKIGVKISDLKKNAIPSAVRKSLISSGKFMQSRSLDEIVKARKMAKSKIRKNYMRMFKYLRGAWTDFNVSVRFLPKPIPLIDFVKGSKKPRVQRGKKSKGGKYPGRKRISVEVVPGQAEKPDGLFIAKTHGKMRAFRRHPDSRSRGRRRKRTSPRIITQNTPAITNFAEDSKFTDSVLGKTGEYMRSEFIRIVNALFK